MKLAAIYARVSSDKQREERTIASQTEALVDFAKRNDFNVLKEWIFEDDGHSGATLERPGLERVRDLAAEGQIQAVLVYSPDRLSRTYAHQYLLVEEFARRGVETRFVKAPQGETPEDKLALQFQGMIAEYERAQTMERSRRGKRHKAKAGEVSVLAQAAYGYIYVKKTDAAPAAWLVNKIEAGVVRQIFKMYATDGLSLRAIARKLTEQRIPTSKKIGKWPTTTVRIILRNTAYIGVAAYGKTRAPGSSEQPIPSRAQRRLGAPSKEALGHLRPREDWIEIPVPPLVSKDVFARAQERLQENKARSKRRTTEPSVAQGLVCCQKCGHALSRRTSGTGARTLRYYACNASYQWRTLSTPKCDSRWVRVDQLDEIVWSEVIRLLEDPAVIQKELDRRLEAARAADPGKDREKTLRQDLTRVANSIERLLTAYQEQLLSLDQLRDRMRPLRQRDGALKDELQALTDQTRDRSAVLSLTDTLTSFLDKLRKSANTLDVLERQRIVRLVVKEVLVGDNAIVIRHCIPVEAPPGGGSGGRGGHGQAKSPVEAVASLCSRGRAGLLRLQGALELVQQGRSAALTVAFIGVAIQKDSLFCDHQLRARGLRLQLDGRQRDGDAHIVDMHLVGVDDPLARLDLEIVRIECDKPAVRKLSGKPLVAADPEIEPALPGLPAGRSHKPLRFGLAARPCRKHPLRGMAEAAADDKSVVNGGSLNHRKSPPAKVYRASAVACAGACAGSRGNRCR
jgi:site-specific DNA recombinase